jgi:hypothetical protein
MIDKIKKEYDVIMITRFGSHLYGTNTPESDTDYKGIYMPTPHQLLEGKFRKSISFDSNPGDDKNGKDDIDCELYSLHYFLELACKGEMVAIDMLHANDENIIYTSDVWELIQSIRSTFYTTDMRAFVGYARKQAAKYGKKGSRLNSAETFLHFLEGRDPDIRLGALWDCLPEDENMKKVPNKGVAMKDLMFNFCGKQLQGTIKIGYAWDIVTKFQENYGHRAQAAKNNEGVDWKAMSHALRAGYQLGEIFKTGNLKFPLQSWEFLRKVKQGKISFDFVIKELEEVLKDVEKLSQKSNFPQKVDREEIDKFLRYTVMSTLIDNYESFLDEYTGV